ncbi:MAG TPA: hypothetical protein VF595_06190 [Tepidisphaeraceae bacterium]
MLDDATAVQRLNVSGRLAFRRTSSGTTISFDDPVFHWVQCLVTGPTEEGELGRALAKIISGPVNAEASGPFTWDNLGSVSESPGVVEVWSLSGSTLPGGKPILGLHVGNRGDDLNGRQIVLAMPSIPRPYAKYQIYTPVDDTLEPTWTDMQVQG